MQALQDQYAPNNMCFGCGPKNTLGLQIKSFFKNDQLEASFSPQKHHQAFDNILSGGICGTLLDCHSNWCAAFFIMQKQGLDAPPCTVTAKYNVTLLHPTPMDKKLLIIAKPTLVNERKAEINAEIVADGKVTATCQGLFVAVLPGHPGYHRW